MLSMTDVEKDYIRTDIPEFRPGDTVVVDAGEDGSAVTFARRGAAVDAGAPLP